jgi:hypothetical protein
VVWIGHRGKRTEDDDYKKLNGVRKLIKNGIKRGREWLKL